MLRPSPGIGGRGLAERLEAVAHLGVPRVDLLGSAQSLQCLVAEAVAGLLVGHSEEDRQGFLAAAREHEEVGVAQSLRERRLPALELSPQDFDGLDEATAGHEGVHVADLPRARDPGHRHGSWSSPLQVACLPGHSLL